jgi:hypothetical protein
MSTCCDICGRTAELALISSGCAPVTYAACAECRENRAESLDVIALWWHLEGRSEAAMTHLARMKVWENGAYVGLDRIISYYEAHRDDLIAEMSDEVELVDDDVPLDEGDKIAWDGEE